VTGAALKVDESKSQVLPQVSLSGNYTRMTLVQEFEMSFMGQTFKTKFGVPNNYDFRATAAEISDQDGFFIVTSGAFELRRPSESILAESDKRLRAISGTTKKFHKARRFDTIF
jgi:hypothetical protein